MTEGGARGRLPQAAATWDPSTDTWYHLALIRGWGGGANDWVITVDGTALTTWTDSGDSPNVTADLQLGYTGTTEEVDIGAGGHLISTWSGTAQLSVAESKWGGSSLLLDGNSDDIRFADHADWNVCGSNADSWTIDLWVKHTDHAGDETYLQHFEGDTDYWRFRHDHGTGLEFHLESGGSKTITISGGGEITDTNWHHVALCKVADEYGCYLDGAQVNYDQDTSTDTFSGSLLIGQDDEGAATYFDGYMDDIRITNSNAFSAAPNVGTTDTITVPTAAHTADSDTNLLLPCNIKALNGYMDEIRISKGVARWSAAFTPPPRAYSASGIYWLVGSDRPLKGVKYYIKNANVVAGTMTCKEWDGHGWQSLTITDGTESPAGTPLGQTGSVTWSTTEDSSRPKYLHGMYLYWYQFYAGSAFSNADIYYTTIIAPFQPIRDIWDGEQRSLLSCQWFNDSGDVYNDVTLNCLMDEYISTNSGTYADLNAFEADKDVLYVGFTERQTALRLHIVSGKQNTTAATTAYVNYWNGTAWTLASSFVDGTSENSISMAQSGVMSWSAPPVDEEFKVEVGNSMPLYFYQVMLDATTPANLPWIYYIYGVPAPIVIDGYKFPFTSHDRLWLCGQTSDKKNSAICSAGGSPVVFNGPDSTEFFFGDDSELTTAIHLYSQFGSSLYNLIMFFKANEIWVLSGNGPTDWVQYRLSDEVGCVAPLTMEVIRLPVQAATGINRSLAIWQGADAIYMSDGRTPIPISGDIANYFDRSDSECIKAGRIGNSVGFIDQEKNEYHWIFTSGTTATSHNKEMVYDIDKNKWFEMDRSSSALIQCGFSVEDTDGNDYTFGTLDTGYMERLENGSDFDGNDLTCVLHTGDIALQDGSIAYETGVRHIKLITTAQSATANEVTCTHYGDSKTTGTDVGFDQSRNGYRIADTVESHALGNYVFHSFKFSFTR